MVSHPDDRVHSRRRDGCAYLVGIVKAVLLIAGAVALTVVVLANYGFNPFALFAAVESEIGFGALHPPAPSGISASLE